MGVLIPAWPSFVVLSIVIVVNHKISFLFRLLQFLKVRSNFESVNPTIGINFLIHPAMSRRSPVLPPDADDAPEVDDILEIADDDVIDDYEEEERGGAETGGPQASPSEEAPARHASMVSLDDSGMGTETTRRRHAHEEPGEFEPQVYVYQRSTVQPQDGSVYVVPEVGQLEMTIAATLRKGEQVAGIPPQERSGSHPEIGDDWRGAAERRGQRTIHFSEVTRSCQRRLQRDFAGVAPRQRPSKEKREAMSKVKAAALAAKEAEPARKRKRTKGGSATVTTPAESRPARAHPAHAQTPPTINYGAATPRQYAMPLRGRTPGVPRFQRPPNAGPPAPFPPTLRMVLRQPAPQGGRAGPRPHGAPGPQRVSDNPIRHFGHQASAFRHLSQNFRQVCYPPAPNVQPQCPRAQIPQLMGQTFSAPASKPHRRQRMQAAPHFHQSAPIHQSHPPRHPQQAARHIRPQIQRQPVERGRRGAAQTSQAPPPALPMTTTRQTTPTTTKTTTTTTQPPVTDRPATTTKTAPCADHFYRQRKAQMEARHAAVEAANQAAIASAHASRKKGASNRKETPFERVNRQKAINDAIVRQDYADVDYDDVPEVQTTERLHPSDPLLRNRRSVSRRANWDSIEEQMSIAATSAQRHVEHSPMEDLPPLESAPRHADEAPPYEDQEESEWEGEREEDWPAFFGPAAVERRLQEEEEEEEEDEEESYGLPALFAEDEFGWIENAGPVPDLDFGFAVHPAPGPEEEEELQSAEAGGSNGGEPSTHADDYNQRTEEEEGGPGAQVSRSRRRQHGAVYDRERYSGAVSKVPGKTFKKFVKVSKNLKFDLRQKLAARRAKEEEWEDEEEVEEEEVVEVKKGKGKGKGKRRRR